MASRLTEDPSPLTSPRPGGTLHLRLRPVLREIGFVATAVVCYLVVGRYTAGSAGTAVAHAHDVLALERHLGIAWEHPVQNAALAAPVVSTLLTQLYVWGYFPTVVALLVWVYARDGGVYRHLRNALLVSGSAGLLVYAFYPCAPPWIGGTGFTDTVSTSALSSVARPAGITNHLGALPSFHVGWVVLVAAFALRVSRSVLLRTWCVLHPMLMAFAVVATGNHWVIDVPAGIVLALLGVLGARTIARLSERAVRGTSSLARRGTT